MGARSRSKMEGAALAIAGGKTLKAAAKAVGAGERTVQLWWADPEFRARVEQLRATMIERSLGVMANTTTKAADVLRKLLESTNEKTRLAAATKVIELTLAMRSATSVEARLAALEQRAKRAGR